MEVCVKPGSPLLTSRKVNTIAIVGPYTEAAYWTDPSNSWAYRIIRGCDSELAEAGFHVAMFSYAVDDPHTVPALLRRLDEAHPTLAGVLCFVGPAVKGLVEELDRRNIAWVTVNRLRDHIPHNFVAHDAFAATRLVGRCFARMGFARALVLSDSFASGRSASDRLFGFMDGWIEAGKASRDVDFVDCAGFGETQGYECFRAHLDRYGPPRGVLASGDLLAQGALRACRERGVSVPEEVAIVGGTGLQFSAFTHPTLTVLDTPMEQMGADAARMLLEMAREGIRRMVGRYSKVRLVVRESCPIPLEILESEQSAIEQVR